MAFVSGDAYVGGYPRSMWIACYTSLILWLFLLLLTFLFGGMGSRKTTRDERGTAAIPDGSDMKGTNTMFGRVKRAMKASRHLFLLLFVTTVFTVLGFGATAGTSTLLWIVFGLGLVWVLVELAINNGFVREIMGWLIYPLIVIIWGLAFRNSNE